MMPAFSRAPLALVTTIIILLAVCNAIDNRVAPSTHRKPPFNGSIFGKRSTVPASLGFAPSQQQQQVDNELASPAESNASPIESLALLVQQQENLIKAAIGQCLSIARVAYMSQGLEQEPLASLLCNEFFGTHLNNHEAQRQPLENKWLYQLFSTASANGAGLAN